MTLPQQRRADRSRGNATRPSLRSAPSNRYGSTINQRSTPPEPKGSNWSFLLLLLLILCCGGPFLVLALGAVGTETLGVAAGIVVALVAAAALILVRRRRAANCCVAPTTKDHK